MESPGGRESVAFVDNAGPFFEKGKRWLVEPPWASLHGVLGVEFAETVAKLQAQWLVEHKGIVQG